MNGGAYLARIRAQMAINQKFVYPGSKGHQIASKAAGEAADMRQVRACAVALSVVGVLEAYGIISRDDCEAICTAEDPEEILLVAELIHAALKEEAEEAHLLTVDEAKHGMLPAASEKVQ